VEKGTYALVIVHEREVAITIGKLGRFDFPSGYYIYVGSARGGLPQRVGRHLKSQKRLRWHIDYLLQFANVVEVWYAFDDESQECFWCHVARGMPQGRTLILGFGSSDCRCPAHLIYFPSLPSFGLFQEGLGEKGAQLKRAKPADFLNS